jgi:hypothetical protein
MASPRGLRLYFGSRLPDEVLDNIFSYGFHLWLAKPHDVIGYAGLGAEGITGTAVFVWLHWLSDEAREMVQHGAYFKTLPVVLIDGSTYRHPLSEVAEWNRVRVWPARPRIFTDIYWEDNFVFRNYSRHLKYQSQPPPPPPWTDEDLDDM